VQGVLDAIASLSSSLRVTLVLATTVPHKQIAEILDIPEGTVVRRVNEARRLCVPSSAERNQLHKPRSNNVRRPRRLLRRAR
jgi:DNA-directed RNA polymerase specialized sigma24 family protein